MSKIVIKKNGVTISVKGSCDIGKLTDVAKQLFKDLSDNNIPVEKSNVSEIIGISNKIVENTNVKSEKPRDNKDYIPGEVNLNSLKIEKAETKTSLVRCPKCGQAHVAILEVSNIENIILVRHGNEFKYVRTVTSEDLDNLMFNKDTMNIVDYFNDFQNFKYTDEDIMMDNVSNVYCPVCDTYNSAEKWVEAYNCPERYFEYDNICDICGGEMCQAIKEENGEERFVCENCNSEKVFKE